MKPLHLKALYILSIFLIAASVPAQAQGSYGLGSGYTCWMCPYCGYTLAMTPVQIASTNPYSVCPYCGSAYAYTFVQVACPDTSSLGNYGSYGTNSNYGTNGDSDTSSSSDAEGKADTSTKSNIDTDSGTDSSLGTDSSSSINNLSSTDSSSSISKGSSAGYGIVGNLGPFSSSRTEEKGSSLLPPDDGSLTSTSGRSQERILMVVAPKDYQAEELDTAMGYFEGQGFSVDVATKGTRHPTPMDEGAGAPPRRNVEAVDLSEARLSDYSAVVFIGGEGIYELSLHEDADYQSLARNAVADGKVVGAICLGPWILANAGLLEGLNATAAETDYLQEKGALPSDGPVVQDGMIVTGSGPSASLEFAEKVASVLAQYGRA